MLWTGAAEPLNRFRREREVRSLPGSKVEYIVSGVDGPPLIILNGGTLIADTAQPLTTLFEERFRTLTPSHPPLLTMAARVQVLLQLMDREGIDRAFVLGQSFGGTLAQTLITDAGDRVAKAVFSATGSPFVPHRVKETLQQAQSQLIQSPDAKLMQATKTRFSAFLPQTPKQKRFWNAVLDDQFGHMLTPGDVRAFYASSADFFAHYPERAPALAEWSGEALIVRADDDPALAALDPARLDTLFPKARVRCFPSGGHMLSVSQRVPYQEVISTFLLSE